MYRGIRNVRHVDLISFLLLLIFRIFYQSERIEARLTLGQTAGENVENFFLELKS